MMGNNNKDYHSFELEFSGELGAVVLPAMIKRGRHQVTVVPTAIGIKEKRLEDEDLLADLALDDDGLFRR